MNKNKELGMIGEQMAVDHLQKKGFTIRKRNYVFDKAEVDIVAEKDNQLVFVEVKTRESAYLSDPALMVSMKKQKQIIKASDAYVKEEDLEMESRFDIISIVFNSKYKKIEHLEDAFYPMV